MGVSATSGKPPDFEHQTNSAKSRDLYPALEGGRTPLQVAPVDDGDDSSAMGDDG